MSGRVFFDMRLPSSDGMSAPSGETLGFLSTGELLVFGDFLMIFIIFFGMTFTLVELVIF